MTTSKSITNVWTVVAILGIFVSFSGLLQAVPVANGLAVHVAADDVDNDSGTSATAGGITTWKNLSTDGSSIGDFTGYGIVELNVLNGLPIVRFGGVSDRFDNDTALGNTVDSDLTVFVVSESNDGNNGGIIQSRTDHGWLFRYSGQTSMLYGHVSEEGSIAPTFTDAFHLFTLARVSTNATISVDGSAGASGTLGGYMAGSGTQIGTDAYGTDPLEGNYLAGDIAEILVYDRLLSDGEINTVGCFLEDKYGLDTAYEPVVPGTLIYGK